MSKPKYKKGNRVAGGFVAFPYSVLRSKALIALTPLAKALLLDVASQYEGFNNGRLLIGWRFMNEEREWKSPVTLDKAKAELLKSKLIIETRKGARPNKSTWVALAWFGLDYTPDMDITPAEFIKGLYNDPVTKVAKSAKNSSHNPTKKIDVLNTDSVQVGGSISTDSVQGRSSTCTDTVLM